MNEIKIKPAGTLKRFDFESNESEQLIVSPVASAGSLSAITLAPVAMSRTRRSHDSFKHLSNLTLSNYNF